MKNSFFIFFIFFIFSPVSNAQILMPYNLDFEEGYLAWELSKKSIANGFNISISDSGAYSGEKYIVLKHSTGKNIISATFYQQVDANFYKNKKVKFEAWYGWNRMEFHLSCLLAQKIQKFK